MGKGLSNWHTNDANHFRSGQSFRRFPNSNIVYAAAGQPVNNGRTIFDSVPIAERDTYVMTKFGRRRLRPSSDRPVRNNLEIWFPQMPGVRAIAPGGDDKAEDGWASYVKMSVTRSSRDAMM